MLLYMNNHNKEDFASAMSVKGPVMVAYKAREVKKVENHSLL